jgi:putative sporulation protein YyaC
LQASDDRRSKNQFRKTIKGDRLTEFLAFVRTEIAYNETVFLCIGTDRSTGDSLGPLVGTLLTEAGMNSVIGTLEHPCDSSNYEEKLALLPKGQTVIAIDACLGQPSSVGSFQVAVGPVKPGQSVGKGLAEIGDYSIAAIVNIDGPRQYAVLQTTPLHRVWEMAKQLAGAILDEYQPDAERKQP